MIGERTLLEATIDGAAFVRGGRRWKALVIPYAYTLSMACYRKAMALAEAGIPVIFFGPQPEFAIGTGGVTGIADDFAARVGIARGSLRQCEDALAHQCGLPGINQWEPEWIDVHCPVKPLQAVVDRDAEGRLRHLKSPGQALFYVPQLDPREDLTLLLRRLVKTEHETYAENAYIRMFLSSQVADRRVIVCVAKGRIADAPLMPDRLGGERPPRKHAEMKALIRTGFGELRVDGGTWCACQVDGIRCVQVLGDSPRVLWTAQGGD